MSAANDAADAIRRLARQYETFNQAAELLDQYGSLENAIAEANRAIAIARTERDKLHAEVTDLTERNRIAEKKAADTLESARILAKQTQDEADSQADTKIVEAERRAATIVADAQAKADRMIGDARQIDARAKQSADAAKQAERESLHLVGKARAELASIQDKITAAKEHARRLLGD